MFNLAKRIWILPLSLLFMVASVQRGYALEPYMTLYPPQGSVLDTIRLEYRAEFNANDGIWIYYDDLCIASDLAQNFGAPPVYGIDYDFKPPNQYPYSNLGFHNITLKAWTNDPIPQKVLIMNATFEIIQYVPCPEYLALNATYYDLLADFEALSTDYNALLANYTDLLADHTSLLTDYGSLLSSYNSLQLSFSSLNTNSNTLTQSYNQLQSNYNSLKASYDSLKADCDSLESSNSDLAANYDTLVGDLVFVRNISYSLAATTMILIGAAVYFAVRKRK